MRTFWSLYDEQISYLHEGLKEAQSALDTFSSGERWTAPAGFDKLIILVATHLRQPQADAKDVVRQLDVLAAQTLGEPLFLSDEHSSPYSQGLIALAVAHALPMSSLEGGMQSVFDLISHSWWLEHLWTDAIVAIAKQTPGFHSDVCRLADEKLINLQSVDAGGNPVASLHFPLSDIWHAHYSFNRRSAIGKWAGLLAALDINSFSETLAKFTSAAGVKIALEATDIHTRFDHWAALCKSAPLAFNRNGSWTKAVLMPVLLESAMSCIGATRDGHSNDNVAYEEAVISLINDIGDALQHRADYEGIVKRWGTWLTRQMVLNPPSDNGIKAGVPITKLLCSLFDRLSDPNCLFLPVAECEPWEPWIYRSMVAILAYEKGRANLDMQPFISEWNVRPEDWFGDRGRSLRARVSLFRARTPDNFGTRALGYSLVTTGDVCSTWLSMWNGSRAMREALEFSTPVPAETLTELSISDGSNTTRVLMDIGLGMLDLALDDSTASSEERRPQARALFGALWAAASEMITIDRYGVDFWIDMMRHLAIRRARWAVRRINAPEDTCAELDDQTLPSVVNIITYFRNDALQLAALLTLYEQNGIGIDFIQKWLHLAQVNAVAVLETIEKLQTLSRRRYQIGKKQIELLRQVARKSLVDNTD